MITGERPTHHYGDEENKVIAWADVVIEKAKKTTKKTSEEGESGKKARKCGYCRCEGHTIRKCPKKEEDLEEKDEEDEVKMSLAEEVKKLKALLAKKDAGEVSDDGTLPCGGADSSIAPTETCDVANLEDFVVEEVKEFVEDVVSQVESMGEDEEELSPAESESLGAVEPFFLLSLPA